MSAAGPDVSDEYPRTWQEQLEYAAGTVDPDGYRTAKDFVAAFEQRYGSCSLDAALRVLRQVADHLEDLSSFLPDDPPTTLVEASATETTDDPDLVDLPAHMRRITNIDVLAFTVYLLNIPPDRPQADEARAALVPLLERADGWLRWGSAISLGHLRDERAFPRLLSMLTEDLPEPEPWPVTSEVERKQCWEQFSFDAGQVDMIGHYKVPEILRRWGDKRAIPDLRAAFVRTVRIERTEASWDPAPIWAPNWHRYQDRLVYTLGHFGAFGALAGIEIPEYSNALWERNLTPDEARRFRVWIDRGSVYRLWRWQAVMCEAALNARATAEERNVVRAHRRRTGHEWPGRRAAIGHLLTEQFGLGEEERVAVLRLFIDSRIFFDR